MLRCAEAAAERDEAEYADEREAIFAFAMMMMLS